MMTRQRYNVVIVGGGAAGLSAALMLGRARRSVLVVDSGQPRNAPAAHMHGYLSRDGTPPGEFLEMGRRDVERYGVDIIAGQVRSAATEPDGIAVEIDGRPTVRARRLLVATGLTDGMPDIPGLAQRWGRDVLHCPYCHGWEVRDQPIGILATGPMSVHQALLFRQWTANLTLLTHTGPLPSDEEAEQLAARGVRVVTDEVTSLEVADDRLVGVRLRTGALVPLRALALAPHMSPRAGVLETLGLTPTPHPSGIAEYIPADAGRTEVPGVWVAGNVTDPAATVLAAAASGAAAAGAINADLVAEDTRLAVRASRRDLLGAAAGGQGLGVPHA